MATNFLAVLWENLENKFFFGQPKFFVREYVPPCMLHIPCFLPYDNHNSQTEKIYS